MSGITAFELGGVTVTLYALLMILGCAACLLLAALQGKKKGMQPAHMCLYGVLAAVTGLFLGRAIYCAVLWDWIYLDELGEFIVDIKDLNPEIYRNYTGGDLTPALENLNCLLRHGDKKKIKLRIPLIPNFNTPADCDRSEALLRSLGAKNIERFDYVIR